MENTRSPRLTRGYWWNSAQWLLGILGGIALFLGFFVMFGPEDDSIGFGGDASWEVGEISDAWMWALLTAGGLMLLGALTMVIGGRRRSPIETTPLMEVLFHVGVFTLVNTFIWIQDIAIGGGVDYAYWITIPWGIGLIAHMWTFLAGRKPDEEVSTEDLTAGAADRELQHH